MRKAILSNPVVLKEVSREAAKHGQVATDARVKEIVRVLSLPSLVQK